MQGETNLSYVLANGNKQRAQAGQAEECPVRLEAEQPEQFNFFERARICRVQQHVNVAFSKRYR